MAAPDLWVARWLVQRGLAAIYLVAFLVAANQWVPLLGERGLLPVPRFLARTSWRTAPSVFRWRYSDRLAVGLAWTGVGVSAVLLSGLPDRWPAWAVMGLWLLVWALYESFVTTGQLFYGFGWESLLLEAGFLAVFLGPSDATAPPVLVMWLLRWLLFRVELGAGLIKLRGDRCWRDLTCLDFHHETQPLPGPLSWWFHHLPRPLHRVETAANHLVQLVAVWGLFAPQPVASAAGVLVVVTQAWLVLSGNFSWLNALTIVLGLGAVSGGWLGWLPVDVPPDLAAPPVWHGVLAIGLTGLVAVLSVPVVRNLLSRRQAMNRSYDPLHLVNTYGAFGSVTRMRYECVVEGTADAVPGPASEWRAYEFKGKPTDPRRRPRQVAPYHLRLDWLLWFVPLSPAYRGRWFDTFLVRLLEGDRATLRLLRHNPVPDRPPRWVRVRRDRYRFSTPQERRATGAWWVREPAGILVGPRSLADAAR